MEKLDSNDNISNKPDESCDIDSDDVVKSKSSCLSVNTEIDGSNCENLDKCELLDTSCTENVKQNCPTTAQTISSSDCKKLTQITDTLEKIQLEPGGSEQTETKLRDNIKFIQYESELQMPMIMKIIQKDLSEPYSIYTYRYFIHNWPKLCFLVNCKCLF